MGAPTRLRIGATTLLIAGLILVSLSGAFLLGLALVGLLALAIGGFELAHRYWGRKPPRRIGPAGAGLIMRGRS
jgi:hypothetical protein